MENNPLPQRRRRSDIYQAAVQEGAPQTAPIRQVQPVQPTQQARQINQAMPEQARQINQAMPEQARQIGQAMPEQVPYRQPNPYRQQGSYAQIPWTQSVYQAQQRSQVQQPVYRPMPENQARQESWENQENQAKHGNWAKQGNRAKPAKQGNREKPEWMTWSIVGLCVMLLALLAAHYLMEAYLTTRAQEWTDAYQETLAYYHVTESADGSYAITYQDIMERYADEYNLQPAFVAAVIRNESSFRTDAESSVGARGLMQLMPDTASWIAGKLGESGAYSFDNLYDAETNIRYGCWYLNYLSRMFRGDAVLVSAAYHAGQTTVTRWLSDSSISSDGVTIAVENLPDGPTKQYAGRVTTTYGIYQALLYPDDTAQDDEPAVGAAGSARADR